ncbi:hypothetical protein M947_07000 [Sulfurimonas hongkongensis]|uniref:Uncharacterized protein n=1 Tax=Sulfurimonas hongkongensis TaxID=1172190 RepID=T0JMP2_9BACT|nr:hypothetical protein [Sulfurimonas hongkongensis]EQB39401.1 hypothetical protein M947_07000 [Sulfurimonas hongkongensis]
MRNIIISALLATALIAVDYSNMSIQELKNHRGGVAPEDKSAFKAAMKAKMQALSPEERKIEKEEMHAFKASILSTTPEKIAEFEAKMKSLTPERKNALKTKMSSLSMEEKFAFKTKMISMTSQELVQRADELIKEKQVQIK